MYSGWQLEMAGRTGVTPDPHAVGGALLHQRIEGLRLEAPLHRRQPGNGQWAEQDPEFCLHRSVYESSAYKPRHTTSSPSSTPQTSHYYPSPSRSRSPSSPSSPPNPSTPSILPALLPCCSGPPKPNPRLSPPPHQQLEAPGRELHSWSSPASPAPRSRPERQALYAARLQRSGSSSSSSSSGASPLGIKAVVSPSPTEPKSARRGTTSPADKRRTPDPLHDQGLVRMAFAEQQRWITVQQKTFTKWCALMAEASLQRPALPERHCPKSPPPARRADDATYVGLIRSLRREAFPLKTLSKT